MKLRIILPMALSAFAFAEDAPHNSNRKLFDPFDVKDDYHLAFMADVLFWQASEGGLGFAIENKGSTSIISDGHVKHPEFQWNVGVKAAIDYKLPSDKWDLLTRYTYLHSTAHKEVTAPSSGAVFPSWQYPTGSSVYATEAKAHWFCNLNAADLELGRNCQVGKWLSIRPYMGLKGVVIHQRYHINYEGGTAVPAGDEDKIKMWNNFWGVGIRFGFNSLWGIGKGLSVYADGAGSLVTGWFNVHQQEHLDVSDTTIVNIRNKPSSVVPIAEIALGLQWDTMFHQDRYHIGVKLGWEMQYYWNQGRFMQFLSSTSPGIISFHNSDLSFMGVTLGVRWDF